MGYLESIDDKKICNDNNLRPNEINSKKQNIYNFLIKKMDKNEKIDIFKCLFLFSTGASEDCRNSYNFYILCNDSLFCVNEKF